MKKLLCMMFALSPMLTFAEQYTFSIVPQQSASRLAKQWTPIMNELSKRTGHDFVFTTAADIPTFEQRLSEGLYDFSYMNPYHFVTFNQAPGYQAIAKAQNKQIKGILVVRKDSGITDLKQLQDETLAFPAPAAFAATILTQADLAAQNINATPQYVSSHDSVYLSVARGFYPAGGGVMRTFKAMNSEIREQLTPIWVTKGYTPHAIASHPRVPLSVTKQVQEIFADLAKTDSGSKLLIPLKIIGFEAAVNDDWDDVRELHINNLMSDKK